MNRKTVARIGRNLASRALDFEKDLIGRMNANKTTEVLDFYHVVERVHEIAKTQTAWSAREQALWAKSRVAELRSGHLSSTKPG